MTDLSAHRPTMLDPAAAPVRPPADVAEVERLLGVLRAGGDARAAKVSKVRRSVLTAEYENDLKLTVAVDRLVDDVSRP